MRQACRWESGGAFKCSPSETDSWGSDAHREPSDLWEEPQTPAGRPWTETSCRAAGPQTEPWWVVNGSTVFFTLLWRGPACDLGAPAAGAFSRQGFESCQHLTIRWPRFPSPVLGGGASAAVRRLRPLKVQKRDAARGAEVQRSLISDQPLSRRGTGAGDAGKTSRHLSSLPLSRAECFSPENLLLSHKHHY